MARYVLRIVAVATLGAGLGLVACGGGSSTSSQPPGPTAADAKAFVEKADAELLDLSRRLSQAQWVSSNFITTDTEAISANTYQTFIAATMKMAKDAARFDAVPVDADTKRRLGLFKLARRTTLRLPPWELFQLGLGLLIPFLLLPHIVNTRIAHVYFGVEDNYLYELARLWPASAILQSTLLLIVWLHGCIGVHYWLLPSVLRLGQSYLEAARLPRLVRPFLQRLSMQTGETANLSVLDGHEIVYLARSNSPRIVSIGFHPGARIPAHVVSPGFAILSTLWGKSPPDTNHSHFRNADYDAGYESFLRTPPGAARNTIARRMSDVVAAYAPIVYRSYPVGNAFLQPWLKGYYPSSFGFSWKYLDIDLAKKRAARKAPP